VRYHNLYIGCLGWLVVGDNKLRILILGSIPFNCLKNHSQKNSECTSLFNRRLRVINWVFFISGIKLVPYWFLFVYLGMVKEMIKSGLFLIVLLTDSASFSAVKLKNKKQKSLDTYSHLVLYLYTASVFGGITLSKKKTTK